MATYWPVGRGPRAAACSKERVAKKGMLITSATLCRHWLHDAQPLPIAAASCQAYKVAAYKAAGPSAMLLWARGGAYVESMFSLLV